MPYKNNDIRREKEKDKYLPRINISMLRNDENVDLYQRIQEAAQNKGISLAKYAILAIKEKLDRDGYI